MSSVQTIPVVELAQLEDNDSAGAFARAVGTALAEIGFFAVENHGVDQELIREAYRAAEGFFTRSDAEKRAYENPTWKGQRGFTSFGREHAKDFPFPDLKEFWHVGRETPSRRNGESLPNVWPDEPAGFRPAMSELYRQLDLCSLRLLKAVAIFLDEPRQLLADMARGGHTILRIIHYPPVPEAAPTAGMRAAPHEDINLITLLCEATAGGLELQQRDGTWLPVEAPPGQIIVDAGDMLQNLTNGLLRSTTHRVTNPTDSRKRRFSMPFFVHPRGEVDLSPLAGCVARTGGVARYPAITAGDYLRQRLEEIGLA